MAPGYFIINELNGEIVKFIKIFITNNYGYPHYEVRAYEKGAVDLDNQRFREIEISVDRDEELHKIFTDFAKDLDGDDIMSMDPHYQGNNHLSMQYNGYSTTLYCFKDVYGVKHATDFIDINLGDNYTCENWQELNNFYSDLKEHTNKKADENDIERILQMKKSN